MREECPEEKREAVLQALMPSKDTQNCEPVEQVKVWQTLLRQALEVCPGDWMAKVKGKISTERRKLRIR